MSTTLTIRLDDDLKEQLTQLAAATQRSKSFLANEAIREFIELNQWQIEEIQKALKEADDGDFASENESERVLRSVRLMARVQELMGSREKARMWLNTTLPALNGKTPLQTAATERGARRVEDLVISLQQGMFS